MDGNLSRNFFQLGNMMRIDNAIVEDVVCYDNSNGYILISNTESNTGNRFDRQIRLNISPNTRVFNSFGQNTCACCIQRGTWISAIFSAAMTRSIPPQANAFVIITQGRRPQQMSAVTIDRIASVDRRNGFVYTGVRNNVNSQTRFVVNDNTRITNVQGRNVGIESLRPGQLVRINHANFQTASIPPQTTAFSIQVL